MVEKLRAVEFYCGIGGMHFAWKELESVEVEVVAAYDINEVTNKIYRHLFPETKLFQNNIQIVSPALLDKLRADAWTMSPPCQPFTRKGNKLGAEDHRCDSLKVILSCLEGMDHPPRYVLVENVQGFEGTSMHERLRNTLNAKGYEIQEYLLTPTDFGIPNSRPRYYLLARLRPQGSSLGPAPTPSSAPSLSPAPFSIQTSLPGNSAPPVPTLSEYLPALALEDIDPLVVEDWKDHGNDITYESRTTACFTKNYGRYLTGCGSYLRETDGRLRRFSPPEVAALMAFPPRFSWPDTVTDRQVYRALGNSVNVRVVAALMARLVAADFGLPHV